MELQAQTVIQEIKNKQPPGFRAILFVEFWERFSFYGLMSLFILYLTKQLHLENKVAYDILGVFFSLTYILPIFGGLAASHFLNYRRAIIMGSFVMALGLILLSFSMTNRTLLYTGLSFVVLGNGLFQPSVTSLLGSLYQKNDPRRDSGFTYYQVCANSGAVLAPLCYGSIGAYFGAEYGFAIAAIGMVLGVLIFTLLQKNVGKINNSSFLPKGSSWQLLLESHAVTIIVLAITILIVPLNEFFQHKMFIQTLLLVMIGIVTVAILFLTAKRWVKNGKDIICMIPIGLFFIVFEALIRLQEGMLTVFTDGYVIHQLGNFTVPTQWFLTFQPLFVIILSTIFAPMWLRLNKSGRSPSSVIKFAFSFLFMALAFGLLAWATYLNANIGQINCLWLIVAYLFQATSELLLIPIAIALLTRLAPKDLMGFMIGCLYLSIGLGSYASVTIAEFTAPDKVVPSSSIEHFILYGTVFKEIAIMAIIMTIILLTTRRFFNWLFSE